MAIQKTIARLNTQVTANAVQFEKEFNRADRIAGRVTKSIGKSVKNLAGTLGVGLGASELVGFGKSVVDLGGQITDLAREANMGTQEFQTLALVGLDSGVQMEQTAKASESLRKSLQDAAAGSKEATDALNVLQLSAAGLQALKPEEQWEVIADRIATATDKQAALNAASDLFGAKNAPKLREVLQRLATEGFDVVSKSVDGMRISDADLKRLDDFGDALGRLSVRAKVLFAPDVADAAGLLDVLTKASTGKGFEQAAAKDSIWTAVRSFLGLGASTSAMEKEIEQAGKNSGTAFADGVASGIEARRAELAAKMGDAKIPIVASKLEVTSDELAALRNTRIETSEIKDRLEPLNTGADRFQRIGLLTGGTGADVEGKKQTSLLEDILEAIKRQSTDSPGVFSN